MHRRSFRRSRHRARRGRAFRWALLTGAAATAVVGHALIDRFDLPAGLDMPIGPGAPEITVSLPEIGEIEPPVAEVPASPIQPSSTSPSPAASEEPRARIAAAVADDVPPIAREVLSIERQVPRESLGAETLLAHLYLSGRLGRADAREAAYWASRAAKAGSPYALYVLLRMFEEGSLPDDRMDSVAVWLAKAAGLPAPLGLEERLPALLARLGMSDPGHSEPPPVLDPLSSRLIEALKSARSGTEAQAASGGPASEAPVYDETAFGETASNEPNPERPAPDGRASQGPTIEPAPAPTVPPAPPSSDEADRAVAPPRFAPATIDFGRSPASVEGLVDRLVEPPAKAGAIEKGDESSGLARERLAPRTEGASADEEQSVGEVIEAESEEVSLPSDGDEIRTEAETTAPEPAEAGAGSKGNAQQAPAATEAGSEGFRSKDRSQAAGPRTGESKDDASKEIAPDAVDRAVETGTPVGAGVGAGDDPTASEAARIQRQFVIPPVKPAELARRHRARRAAEQAAAVRPDAGRGDSLSGATRSDVVVEAPAAAPAPVTPVVVEALPPLAPIAPASKPALSQQEAAAAIARAIAEERAGAEESDADGADVRLIEIGRAAPGADSGDDLLALRRAVAEAQAIRAADRGPEPVGAMVNAAGQTLPEIPQDFPDAPPAFLAPGQGMVNSAEQALAEIPQALPRRGIAGEARTAVAMVNAAGQRLAEIPQAIPPGFAAGPFQVAAAMPAVDALGRPMGLGRLLVARSDDPVALQNRFAGLAREHPEVMDGLQPDMRQSLSPSGPVFVLGLMGFRDRAQLEKVCALFELSRCETE